jgi:hypothetical protein
MMQLALCLDFPTGYDKIATTPNFSLINTIDYVVIIDMDAGSFALAPTGQKGRGGKGKAGVDRRGCGC